MEKILVSACLLGQAVRYDGTAKTLVHPNPMLARWLATGRLVPVCPEMAAGLGVPRPPAEIAAGASGEDVLSGRARVLTITGTDVTASYVAGATAALALAQTSGCAFALLTDGSPSCGSGAIYDGSFAGRRHAGAGVTAALLRRHGVEVFSPERIGELQTRLSQELSVG